MKPLLTFALLSLTCSIQTIHARTVEVDVFGMTCPFCLDSVERKFGKMKTVSRVNISLKLKKIRLETDDAQPSVTTIRNTVLDAGFTPIKISILPDEKK